MGTHGQDSKDLKLHIMRQHKSGMSITDLAEAHGLPRPTLYGWRAQYRKYGDDAFIGCGHSRETECEIAALREEIARLKGDGGRRE
jgi:transposase-like protein